MPKQPIRMLLVDDDRWLLESMSDWLGGQGFNVNSATKSELRRKSVQ
jgi:DNA-binding response OmpR family regulator